MYLGKKNNMLLFNPSFKPIQSYAKPIEFSSPSAVGAQCTRKCTTMFYFPICNTDCKQRFSPSETVIKKIEYLSSYFIKIHNSCLFQTFDCILQQLAWLLCLLPYKLAFLEKHAKNMLLMFTLQPTTKGVLKNSQSEKYFTLKVSR